MKPANDHEKDIAWRVDGRLLEDPDYPYHLIVRDIAMALEFIMSATDTKFLVHYIHWRDAHPVAGPRRAAHLEVTIQ
jgi:hypothetical protein